MKRMKTASEMRAMAQGYPFKGLMKPSIDKLPFEQIEQSLSSDEEVILAFGAYGGNIGKTLYQKMAIAFTSKRLLIAGQPNSMLGGLAKAGAKSIRTESYHSVGLFGKTVRMDSHGDEDIVLGNYDATTGQKLANEIQVILDNQRERVNTNQSGISSADELKKYKDLLDSGIITQEEFDAKKKQLLGL